MKRTIAGLAALLAASVMLLPGADPSPDDAKLSIKPGPPGYVDLHVEASSSLWYEIMATEDFVTWHTLVIAFGQDNDSVYTWPTTGVFSPFTGELGRKHLFFKLCLHDKSDPIPPL